MITTDAIAILGSGGVASVLADAFTAAGHDVTVGSRDPRRRAAGWTSPARLTGLAGAAAAADVVINATPGASSLEILRPLAAELAGKILVDVANAVDVGPDGFASALRHPQGSLAEELQRALPATRVVKTLNTMGPAALMADPQATAAMPTVFLSGDDGGAKEVVAGLLAGIGWPRESMLDLGDVTTARFPEAFVLLVAPIVHAYGPVPFGLAVAR